ncbi:unnamed protein product [Closterium sp. Naga37s-1]|nr:unnamed protein product [Closterium sp. Naga37s-1]
MATGTAAGTAGAQELAWRQRGDGNGDGEGKWEEDGEGEREGGGRGELTAAEMARRRLQEALGGVEEDGDGEGNGIGEGDKRGQLTAAEMARRRLQEALGGDEEDEDDWLADDLGLGAAVVAARRISTNSWSSSATPSRSSMQLNGFLCQEMADLAQRLRRDDLATGGGAGASAEQQQQQTILSSPQQQQQQQQQQQHQEQQQVQRGASVASCMAEQGPRRSSFSDFTSEREGARWEEGLSGRVEGEGEVQRRNSDSSQRAVWWGRRLGREEQGQGQGQGQQGKRFGETEQGAVHVQHGPNGPALDAPPAPFLGTAPSVAAKPCSAATERPPVAPSPPRCLLFSPADLATITDGFAQENFLGSGAYGPVYRGRLDPTNHSAPAGSGDSFEGAQCGNQTGNKLSNQSGNQSGNSSRDGMQVAVKVHRSASKQEAIEAFVREVDILLRVQHTHIVRLLQQPERQEQQQQQREQQQL